MADSRKRTLSSATTPEYRKNATLYDKLMVLNWYHANGRNQSKTAKHFQEQGFSYMKQPLVSAWVKREDDIREQASSVYQLTSRRIGRVRNPDFEKALTIFVQQAEVRGLTLTGDLIRAAGARFYDQLGVSKDKRQPISNGWLSCFKKRTGLRLFRFHGEASSANIRDVESERARLAVVLADWEPRNIFNMDETALFYAKSPDKGLATKPHQGTKQPKTRLTIAFTANADGTERLPPLVIGLARRPRCFQKKTGEQLGFNYYSNTRAWMTGDIFRHWLAKWNGQLRRANRKVLLLVDNFSGHKFDASITTNIHVEYFAPNLTAHVQPMDAGIICCFKAHYRRHFLHRSLDIFSTGASNFHDISVLQAMRLVHTAWGDVSDETIAHCWHKSGILPVNANSNSLRETEDLATAANCEQEASLADIKDCYEEFNRIQPGHMRLPIKDLVNPAEENDAVALENLNDDEIVKYVIENRETEQEIVIDESDGEQEVKPVMSVESALNAVENLEQFVALEGGQEFRDAARELARIKHTLRKRVMVRKKQTTLTGFFSGK